MSELYVYDVSTHLTTIDEGAVELTQSAEQGMVGSGSLVLADEAGTLAITGQKGVLVTQSSCATPRTYRGFVSDRVFSRDLAPTVTTSRSIRVALEDLNATLGFRIIDGSDGKRAAETVAVRMAWLLASDYLSGLVIDNGRVSALATKGMDAADYRGQFPGDVLADMALASGSYNWHVQDYGSGAELIFRDDNASSADSSSLRISNVLSDASAVTYNPAKTGTLTRRPGLVWSKIGLAYAKRTVYDERPATAAAFNGERGGTASNSNIKTAAKAADELARLLWEHHLEEDVIECVLEGVTDAHVNLIMPGYRLEAKFSHLATEGYGSFTWFRVLERKVTPMVPEGTLYRVALKLSPQEDGPPAATIVQSAFGRGGAGANSLTLPNPVEIDGGGGEHVLVAIVTDRGTPFPQQPSDDGGAWTRLNGVARTAAERGTGFSGIAAYWKVTNSTDNTIGFHDYSCFGVWELDGVDMASVTVVAVDDQSAVVEPAVMDIGSLGSPAAGEIVLMGHVVVTRADGSGFGDYRTDGIVGAPPSSGWTQRFWNGPVDFSYGVWPATYFPLSSFCDGEGAGSAVTGKITRASGLAYPPPPGGPGHTSLPIGWAGIALKIPPA